MPTITDEPWPTHPTGVIVKSWLDHNPNTMGYIQWRWTDCNSLKWHTCDEPKPLPCETDPLYHCPTHHG